MMCSCEEEFARRFLVHQIREGTELETQRRIPVTLGFQARVCNACRGLPEEAHPRAQTYGRTSKVVRYYWREIWFETTRRFTDWCTKHGHADPSVLRGEHAEVRKLIERDVIEEMKTLHERSPKYRFQEQSQSEVLTKHHIEVVRLDGVYVRQAERKAMLYHANRTYSAEEFAAQHFEGLGYHILETESIPFHALFGVFFWLLIQDPGDPRVRIVGFGERAAFEQGQRGKEVWSHLPEDFGMPGYARRRASAIDEHFSSILAGDTKELLWKFDYWVPYSDGLRQYLWAHRHENIVTARQLVSILPADVIRVILRYLIGDYWQRFCGWPDLLAYKQEEFLFLEVKSSSDELSEDQKRWIAGNSTALHLPFKLVKIHKKKVIELPETAGA
jgi:hypothetical protein